MDADFIGRKEELQLLQNISKSGRAEFVAVYGRRRVGKTYLIQQFFEGHFAFSATGMIDGSREEEMFTFTRSLIQAGYAGEQPRNWLEAFEFLKPQLEKKYQVVDLFKSVHNLLVVDIVDAPALVEVIEFNPQEGYIIMRDIEYLKKYYKGNIEEAVKRLKNGEDINEYRSL